MSLLEGLLYGDCHLLPLGLLWPSFFRKRQKLLTLLPVKYLVHLHQMITEFLNSSGATAPEHRTEVAFAETLKVFWAKNLLLVQ